MKQKVEIELSSSLLEKVQTMIVPVAAVAFGFSVLAAGYFKLFQPQTLTKPTQDPVAEQEEKIEQLIAETLEPGRFFLRVRPEALPHIKGQEWVDLERDVTDEQLRNALKNIPGIKIRRIAPTTFENGTLVLKTRDGETYDATQEFALYTDPKMKRKDLQPVMDAIPSVQTFFQFSKIKLLAPREKDSPPQSQGGPDPGYEDEWRFHRDEPYGVNMEGAWDFGVSGANVRVGFIDSSSDDIYGVEQHPDLSSQISDYNSEAIFSGEGCEEHGVLTSQQAVAEAQNGVGTKGGAFNAELIFNNASTEKCNETAEDRFYTMLDLAASQNLDVLNLSIASPMMLLFENDFTQTDQYRVEASKMSAIQEVGTAIFSGAGNTDESIIADEEGIPIVQNIFCFMEGVTCVGATNRNGYRATDVDGKEEVGSGYGPVGAPVVLAGVPSHDIPLYFYEQGLKIYTWGGTSSSAPVASAIGALVKECLTNHSRSFRQAEDKARTIQNIVLHNTRPMQCSGDCPGNGDGDFPNGILDAGKAVESACSDHGDYSAEIDSPTENGMVSGQVNVEVIGPSFPRHSGIEFIELFLDDVPLPDARRTEAFDYPLDTTLSMNGDHVFHTMTRYTDGATFFSRRIHVTFDNFGNPNNEPPPGGYSPPPGDPGGPFDPEFFHAPTQGDVARGIIPVKVEVGKTCRRQGLWTYCGSSLEADKWNIFLYANGKEIGRAEHLDHAGAVIAFNLDTTDYDDGKSVELVLKEEALECGPFSICWTIQEPLMTSRIFITPYNSDPSENTPFFTQPGRTSIDVEEGSGQSLTFQVSSAHPEFIQSAELWFYSQYAPNDPVRIATDTTAPFVFENIPVSTWGTNKLYTFYAEATDINGVRLSSKLMSLREVYVLYRTCNNYLQITSPNQTIVEPVDTEAVLIWGLSINPCHPYEDLQAVKWYVDDALVIEQSAWEEAEYSTENLEDGDHPLKLVVKFNDGSELLEGGILRVEHNPLPACSEDLPLGLQPEEYSEIKGETLLTLQQPVRSDLQWVRWEGERRGEMETIDETSVAPYTGHWFTRNYSNHKWIYHAIGLLDNGALACSEWRDVVINNHLPEFQENVEDQF